MSTARQLLDLINDTTVGTLSAQDDIWRFAYAPEWIASPQAFALAPGLPLSTTKYIDGASQRPVQWHFQRKPRLAQNPIGTEPGPSHPV